MGRSAYKVLIRHNYAYQAPSPSRGISHSSICISSPSSNLSFRLASANVIGLITASWLHADVKPNAVSMSPSHLRQGSRAYSRRKLRINRGTRMSAGVVSITPRRYANHPSVGRCAVSPSRFISPDTRILLVLIRR